MLSRGNYRMRLKHLIVSESKESTQKIGLFQRDRWTNLEKSSYIHSWNNFKQSKSGDSMVKNAQTKAGNAGSVPGSGWSPGVGNGNPLQYSCLENSMDTRAWQATVHEIAKSWTQLGRQAHVHIHTCTHTHTEYYNLGYKMNIPNFTLMWILTA